MVICFSYNDGFLNDPMYLHMHKLSLKIVLTFQQQGQIHYGRANKANYRSINLMLEKEFSGQKQSQL